MKVVVCDHVFPNIEQEKKALACVPDLEVIDAHCTSKEEVIAACADADGVINQYNMLTEEVVSTFKKCRVIATYGIGLDKYDIDAISKRGIYLCNSPDYNKTEVSDHIVSMIMALERNLLPFTYALRRGDYAIPFSKLHPQRPSVLTVGFVGYGRIARQAAHKLQAAFGMNVICYDPFVSEEDCAAAGGRKVDLKTLMSTADFVSINVSLLPTTRGLVGPEEIALMKPTAYLVNCSRGGIVDEPALVQALRTGKIAGAGLDTFVHEPLSKDDPLCALDNVILTPHAAWFTEDAMREVQYQTGEQVAMVLTGQTPTHCVNYDQANQYRK